MNDLASVPPNQGKRLTIELDGVAHARHPLRTPLVREGDDVVSVVRDAVQPYLVAGDIVVVSEKIVAIELHPHAADRLEEVGASRIDEMIE